MSRILGLGITIIWFAVLILGLAGCEGDTDMSDFDDEGLRNDAVKPKDGWSASGKMVTGNANKRVTMQANFPEAGTYTVEFDLTLPTGLTGSSANTPIRAEALITWSVAGNSIARRVTIGRGTSISGVAQAVRVEVMDTTLAAGGGDPPSIEYSIGIQVAKGQRASDTIPPTYSPHNATIPQSATTLQPYPSAFSSVNVPIPADAGVKSVMVAASAVNGASGQQPTPDPFVIVWMRQGTVNLQNYRVGAGLPGFVPVPAGCDSILVQNIHTVDYAQVSVLFGIDG